MDNIAKLKQRIKRRLRKHGVCDKCKLSYRNEANKNKCIDTHRLNVMVRWDLIIDVLDEAFALERNEVTE